MKNLYVTLFSAFLLGSTICTGWLGDVYKRQVQYVQVVRKRKPVLREK